jgi:hypothetical protein
MCADICVPGTVEVDEWATKALKYQRYLQRDSLFSTLELPGTHNSGMSEAYGFGIEKYFISTLYNAYDTNRGDDVGEGVCQHVSLLDQLNMGLRHLEVDIWWWPSENDVVSCHSPIPLWPVGDINRRAEEAGLDLEWDPLNMCCIHNRRAFADVLQEVKGWLDANPSEFMVLYIDLKARLTSEHVVYANGHIEEVFGDMLYRYTEGSPMNKTVTELLSKGKQLLIESNKDDWLTPAEGQPIVFYPTLWDYQISLDGFEEFPACSAGGSTDWYGKTMVRALDGSFIEAATRCGVNIVSGDYTEPDEMKLFVWSWDVNEPSMDEGCVAMLPNGRWATLDCSTALPYACQGETDTAWTVDLSVTGPWVGDQAVCQEGYTHDAPRNGYTNGLLWLKSYAQTVWLNAPAPASV